MKQKIKALHIKSMIFGEDFLMFGVKQAFRNINSGSPQNFMSMLCNALWKMSYALAGELIITGTLHNEKTLLLISMIDYNL
jgi:hypothetical protein